jgi:hypothetical protein
MPAKVCSRSIEVVNHQRRHRDQHFSTTTSRLTPRRASVCLSHTGYSVAYPTPPRSADRAILDHRPPGITGPGVVSKDHTGPYEVSLDRSVNVVAAVRRNHLLEPSHLGRS